MTWPFPGIPPGEYPTLLVDKPWRFKVRSETGNQRKVPYKTMTDEQLMAMPIIDLCARDTFLFMWTSGTMIERSLAIMKAWEFVYSSFAFVWVKLNPRAPRLFYDARSFHFGMGYTTRKNVEVCLLGRRGAPKRLRNDIPELILAPRRQHSRKPDEIYERIEAFAQGPRAELFSRGEAREGWSIHGDEIGKFAGENAA